MLSIARSIITFPIFGSLALFLYRLRLAFSHLFEQIGLAIEWLFLSRETTNLTYELTDLNESYLASFVSSVTRENRSEIVSYFRELDEDYQLRCHIQEQTVVSKWAGMADKIPKYGRRKAWYAIVRITKPKVVVETGVDKGLGACVITSALLKNRSEGHPGHYYGIDINPEAGYLLSGYFREVGEVLVGDSIQTLRKLQTKVDLFINDSDHSKEYESREYEEVAPKLSHDSIVLGDNSHCSDRLLQFSESHQREFLFFQEQPKHHWYRGSGIGASFYR